MSEALMPSEQTEIGEEKNCHTKRKYTRNQKQSAKKPRKNFILRAFKKGMFFEK